MSYILESLKKSEQERQKGSAPGLHCLHDPAIRKMHGRRSIWKWALVGTGLLFNGVVLALWLLPGQPAQEPPPGGTSPASGAGAPFREAAAPGLLEGDQPFPSPGNIEATPREQVLAAALSRIALSGAGGQQEAEKAGEGPVSLAEETEELPASGVGALSGQPSASRIGNHQAADDLEDGLSELPVVSPFPESRDDHLKSGERARTESAVEKRGANPAAPPPGPRVGREKAAEDFRISAHFYSRNPVARLVSINGSILREGQEAGGLRVEEITEQGVIFWYSGERRYRSVF